ncbi:hypothetical protein A2U01_0005765 [Trifolium medium]|uniref:Uncharacterized protein n=1 Tax=Trifolium medium TaxID=97028 RepID=A0A392MBN5_9FABA|nr:hypothetical protein [Trifolium medium]
MQQGRSVLSISDGRVRFDNMKFRNDDDVRIMFSIFPQYSTKGPIELDVTISRFIQA